MGKITKRFEAFLLSFVMLLTLSGFWLSAKAKEVSDNSCQQNQYYFQLCLDNEVRLSSLDLDIHFTARYQQSDGTWISVMDREILGSGKRKVFAVPVGAKKIEYKAEQQLSTGSSFPFHPPMFLWECLDKGSVVPGDCCTALVKFYGENSFWRGLSVHSRVLVE